MRKAHSDGLSVFLLHFGKKEAKIPKRTLVFLFAEYEKE